mmetsp:Transcript_4173/g.10572  ORF Transcript_4173/g.10572 Transcript_4173/m.10572 type:complete len:241 (-) Transcript_4173:141-863(-)
MTFKDMFWVSRSTGTTRPRGDETAMEMSVYSRYTISLSSITALTAGISCRAAVAAATKADMKPSLTPCTFSNWSLYLLRRFMRLLMSTSLKVVRRAAVDWPSTRRSAILRRMGESLTRFSRRAELKPGEEPAEAAGALGASALGAAFFSGAAALGAASFFGASALGASALAGAGVSDSGALAGAPPAGASAFLNLTRGSPTRTSVSTGTKISTISPAVAARTGKVTLSVSMVQSSSSSAT